MFSLTKFFNWLNEQDLSLLQRDALAELVIQPPKQFYLRPRELSRLLGITLSQGLHIIEELIASELFEAGPLICKNCGTNLGYLSNTCSVCEEAVDRENELFITVNGTMNKQDLDKLSAFNRRFKELQFFLEKWNIQETIYYIMLDVVGSEPITKTIGDDNWKTFLDSTRKIIQFKVLSQLKDRYFSFGEIGDMHKIAICSPADVFLFFKLLSGELEQRYLNAGNWFPCFSAKVIPIGHPMDIAGNKLPPESAVTYLMNGSADFNSNKLTRGYRLESSIKTNTSIYKDKCNISVWLFKGSESILPDADNIIWEEIKYKKGNIDGSDYACLCYFNNGLFNGVESSPSSLRIKS